MGKTFTILTIEGAFRSLYEFQAESLDAPDGIPADDPGFTDFLTSYVVHNGASLMTDGRFGIEVQVTCHEDQTCEDMLLLVNNALFWNTYAFQPLEYDAEGELKDRRMLMDAASFVIAYGREVFDTQLPVWEDAGMHGLELLVDMGSVLMDESMPWKGFLHVRSVPMLDEYGIEAGRGPINAFSWRFLDGSVMFITEKGLKTPDEYQNYAVGELKIPVIDGDWDVPLKSIEHH